MKKLSTFVFSLCAVLLTHGAVGSDSPMKFPVIEAANLEGQKFALPHDLGGERNLLLIAFEREQQKNLDTWLHEMKRFEEVDPAFRYYELPTISRLNPFSRWFIDNGMRRGIPDKKARERTITLYIDKKPFEESLQIPTEKTVYAILVDRSGEVLWRADGNFDEQKAEGLRKVLEQQAGRK